MSSKRPVMWRVMDDNIWRVFSDEKEAQDYADKIGMKDYQGLYVLDGPAAAEAGENEIEKLRRQRIEFDCRYTMGNVADLTGSHCPIDKPCLRCQNERLEAATIERCAQYHDKAADDCEKIAAVNMDNKLGADCLTRAQDHREDAAAIRAMKEKP